ncbi:helix-turn-helix domain-containing protein [Amycolatopsis aidingensis]|uniref:helix-turn-helix domain-containing protein n=1 Tax=Amycolatopsis aidingensis TaxID=2842453 RepID=UPI001C0C1B8F|nr:helix-turn-helix transcriptional regulator [Amycolatopsis aidingensis]
MNEHLARVVGDRVRFYRTAARQTKTVVAGLTGITPDYLYQIERGQKLPTITVLAQLADVLYVELGDLLSHRPTPEKQHNNTEAGDALYRALTNPISPAPTTAPALPTLHDAVQNAWHTWQTSPQRYSSLNAQLPELVADATSAVRVAAPEKQRDAQREAADLYCLLRTVTKRVGRSNLALLAADRAVQAAEAADDPIRLAGAKWNLTQVLLADGQAEGAEEIAMQAVEELRSFVAADHADALALSGALLLIAGIAAVRRGDAWTARDRLHEAAPLAEQTGERNTCWTAFGPTNVAMYAVTIEVESGEAVEGLRLAERINHDRSPSIERRVAFLLDQAKGYQQRRDYASALLLLNTAEREAPEDVRFRPAAHVLLRTVVERGRRSVSLEASRLASRVGLPL